MHENIFFRFLVDWRIKQMDGWLNSYHYKYENMDSIFMEMVLLTPGEQYIYISHIVINIFSGDGKNWY